MKAGDRVRCVNAGSTLLVDGFVYVVHEVLEVPDLHGMELIEVDRCRGFLFGPWRFVAVD